MAIVLLAEQTERISCSSKYNIFVLCRRFFGFQIHSMLIYYASGTIRIGSTFTFGFRLREKCPESIFHHPQPLLSQSIVHFGLFVLMSLSIVIEEKAAVAAACCYYILSLLVRTEKNNETSNKTTPFDPIISIELTNGTK